MMTNKGVGQMAVSEAQKRASRKYDKENIHTVSCRLRMEEYEKMKAYAESNDTTISKLIADFCRDLIKDR